MNNTSTESMQSIAAPDVPSVVSVGSLIDQYFALRESLRDVQAQEKELKATMSVLEEELIKQYDAQGVTLCRGRSASASLTTTEVPVVSDWPTFWQYVFDNQASHLLERRPSTAAWRELRESGEQVPGTEPFIKRGISVRKL